MPRPAINWCKNDMAPMRSNDVSSHVRREALKLGLNGRLLPVQRSGPPIEANRRKSARRSIGYGATIVAPDSSWTRKCRVLDVSESGAKLALEEPGELPKDFVLMLSERGGPTRRCHVVWETADQLGVEFERPKKSGAGA